MEYVCVYLVVQLNLFLCLLAQCCEKDVAAAEAGQLQFLQGLWEAGRFLPLDSPDWASAGEGRKLEIWNAAFTACKADHAHLLSWLFASGWPSTLDARPPWHMGDMLETSDGVEEDWPVSDSSCPELELRNEFLPELNLYRQAVRNPTSACLEALLEAGCRSVWICRLAAQEGKPAFLTLAARWGCRCDAVTLGIAAKAGNLPLLKEVHRAALLPNGFLSQALSSDDAAYINQAAKGGVDCLHALERAGFLNLDDSVQVAAERAQVECLEYLVNLEPSLLELPLLMYTAGACKAPARTIIDCMNFLRGRGCQWEKDGIEMEWAAEVGRPEVLQYCLDQVQVQCWEKAMHVAYLSGSVECMQVLYDNGYEQHRLAHGWAHPATLDSEYEEHVANEVDCLRLAVRESGKVNPEELSAFKATGHGEDMLRYVIELGAPLDGSIVDVAAAGGRVKVLQIALAT
eukprot:jgi/Botrbrau1/11334/Bobra.0038s0093.1